MIRCLAQNAQCHHVQSHTCTHPHTHIHSCLQTKHLTSVFLCKRAAGVQSETHFPLCIFFECCLKEAHHVQECETQVLLSSNQESQITGVIWARLFLSRRVGRKTGSVSDAKIHQISFFHNTAPLVFKIQALLK